MKRGLALVFGCLSAAVFATDYYVDANYGNDAWDGSTPEIPTQETIDAGGVIPGPRQTLQAGVDLAKKSGDVVHAAPGVYDKGGATGGNCSNRVALTVAGIGLIADQGKDVTFIEGYADPRATEEDGTVITNKCGNLSVRCVYAPDADTAWVRGFTLTNGYSRANKGDSTAYGTGGGARGGTFVDCTFVRCGCGYRGADAQAATLIGCRLNAGTAGSYSMYQCKAYNCVVVGAFNGAGPYVNCTFTEGGQGSSSGTGSYAQHYNCYVYSPKKWSAFYRCYHRGTTNALTSAYTDGCRQITTAEANLDASSRPQVGSVLVDAGSEDLYEQKYYAALKDVFGRFDCDFTARIKGRTIDIGAFEFDWGTVPRSSLAAYLSSGEFLSVTDASASVYGNGAKDALTLPVGAALTARWANPSGPARDAEVTFTAEVTGEATLKVYLNGAQTPTWTLTAADGAKTITYLSKTADTLRFVSEGDAGDVTLSAFTTTAHKCYYVKPDGDDGADGLTLATAKRTLSGAMKISDLKAVGMVYAAPGVYREGASDATGASNRVSVVAGVGLESIEGPEVTVIEGSADPGTEAEGVTNGCGFAAVRGAYVGDDAWLRGFTVRNGHTRVVVGTSTSYNGGGVYADGGTVVDCIITNNVAGYRGGGGAYGNYIRCTIGKNMANGEHGPGVVNGSLFGCYCHDAVTYGQTRVVNCTFLDCYPRGNGVMHVFNTICNKTDSKNGRLHRCLYGGKLASTSEADDLTEMALGETTVNKMLDANQVPKYGSKPVDFGDVNHYVTNFPSAFSRFMWLDCRGAPRVSNGKIDCGAFEYDWRGDFAARMKRTARYQLVVESASADVTTNALGQVTLTDGTSLSAVWTVAQDDRMSFFVPVTGAGVVTVTVDGQAVTPESVTGFCELDVAAGKHKIEIAFAGEGSATAHTFSLTRTGSLLLLR